MIRLLFGLALATAVPLGVGFASRVLGSTWARVEPRLAFAAAALALIALALPVGPIAVAIALPWLVLTVVLAGAGVLQLVAGLFDRRIRAEPWRIGAAAATGFLAVGAAWLAIDRAGLRPFDFDPTIVLLTAVHFHVAGFVLTLAATLATRTRPGIGSLAAVLVLVIGIPLTALGFFGLPLASWIGAVLVAGGGIGIGLTTIAIARGESGARNKVALTVAGATLFVTMPIAAAYATGTAFGIAFLDIPAMAAMHGGLNVFGFAIPAMVGWQGLVR